MSRRLTRVELSHNDAQKIMDALRNPPQESTALPASVIVIVLVIAALVAAAVIVGGVL